MRKLASIQKIISIEPIENSDNLEKAKVLGWSVVVKKGEFKAGDLCVYCEIDSFLPDQPEFEFLRPRKMRIRTVRLRGQISQGICFSLNTLFPPDNTLQEGDDVTEILGIKKYEPFIPVQLQGEIKGNFPSFIPKTDETRIQSIPGLIEKYKDIPFYISEKVDGTSVTFYQNNGEFGVCSRNFELKFSESNTYWQMAIMLDIENKLKSIGGNYAIQGEIVGPGIQKNKLGLDKKTVLFFNVFDIDKFKFLDFRNTLEFIHGLELRFVQIIAYVHILDKVESLVERITMKSQIKSDEWIEGGVFRPAGKEIYDDEFGRISFKVINPEWLLKYE